MSCTDSGNCPLSMYRRSPLQSAELLACISTSTLQMVSPLILYSFRTCINQRFHKSGKVSKLMSIVQLRCFLLEMVHLSMISNCMMSEHSISSSKHLLQVPVCFTSTMRLSCLNHTIILIQLCMQMILASHVGAMLRQESCPLQHPASKIINLSGVKVVMLENFKCPLMVLIRLKPIVSHQTVQLSIRSVELPELV